MAKKLLKRTIKPGSGRQPPKGPITPTTAVIIAKVVKAEAEANPEGDLGVALDKVTKYIDAVNYEEYVRQPSLPGLPQFLRDAALQKPTLSTDKLKDILDNQTGTRREWIMPDNSPEAQARRSAEKIEKQKLQIFAHDETVAVTVSVKTDEGPKTLAVYQNMADFREKHDFATYPFRECRSDKDQTVILVGAKPWAGREKVPGQAVVKVPAGKSKAEMIGEMLMRPEGLTSKEVCSTMGWPSVSMPAQAKAVGLKLRKEKVDGVTRYWGTK